MNEGRPEQLLAQLAASAGATPPEHWSPPYCGELDLRIARDGQWYYQGEPIRRESLICLFASVLRREGERYYLVTPVEKVGIQVEDAPFVAIDVEVEREGKAQRLTFLTGQGERISAGPGHPLRVAIAADGEPRPYLEVRAGLEALIHRNVFYRLAALAVSQGAVCGVWSDGQFFALEG